MNASQRKEKLHLPKHLHTHIHSIKYWRIHQWIFKTLVYTYWVSTQSSKRNELARCGDACLLAQPQRSRQMTTYAIQEDPVSRAKQNKQNWLDTSLQESPVSFSCFWSHSPSEPATHHIFTVPRVYPRISPSPPLGLLSPPCAPPCLRTITHPVSLELCLLCFLPPTVTLLMGIDALRRRGRMKLRNLPHHRHSEVVEPAFRMSHTWAQQGELGRCSSRCTDQAGWSPTKLFPSCVALLKFITRKAGKIHRRIGRPCDPVELQTFPYTRAISLVTKAGRTCWGHLNFLYVVSRRSLKFFNLCPIKKIGSGVMRFYSTVINAL